MTASTILVKEQSSSCAGGGREYLHREQIIEIASSILSKRDLKAMAEAKEEVT